MACALGALNVRGSLLVLGGRPIPDHFMDRSGIGRLAEQGFRLVWRGMRRKDRSTSVRGS
jgi:hypothetical protein